LDEFSRDSPIQALYEGKTLSARKGLKERWALQAAEKLMLLSGHDWQAAEKLILVSGHDLQAAEKLMLVSGHDLQAAEKLMLCIRARFTGCRKTHALCQGTTLVGPLRRGN
jgi:hypothetical protein